MKRAALLVVVLFLLGGLTAMAGPGNGAPSGAHYNLNIIGVSHEKTADMTGDNGHRIFVGLGNKDNASKTQIKLYEAPDDETFAVLDANGTDGSASFMLPNPDPNNTGTSWYSVWARALGKPGGKANMNTCAEWLNPDTGQYETVCSLAVLEMERYKGKSSFGDVSAYLLYIYTDLDGDGVAEHYNIFDDAFQDYFWEYDNYGLKLLQLRFYPGEPSTVPPSWPPQ